MERFIINADGGARGNPGPAAIGYVIRDGEGRTLKSAGEAIGEATNNIAEYRAVIAALKRLKAFVGSKRVKRASVEVRMDSELVVRQVNRQYKVKSADLAPLFIELWNLAQDFGAAAFTSVPRGENSEADRLVNEALDREQPNLDF